MMSAEEFFATVKQMRIAQMRYFKTRDKADLAASKNLEKQVDTLLVEWQQKRFLKDLNHN